MGLWGRGPANGSKKPPSLPLYFWGLSLETLTIKPEVTELQNDLHRNLVWTPTAQDSRLQNEETSVPLSSLLQGDFPLLPLTGPWPFGFLGNVSAALSRSKAE